MALSFPQKKFFKSKITWISLTLALLSGLMLFWPNLFASDFILDSNTIKQEQIKEIFEDLASGEDYETLSQISPNMTEVLVRGVFARLIGNPDVPDAEVIEQNLNEFIDSPEKMDALLDDFLQSALARINNYFPDINPEPISIKITDANDIDSLITYFLELREILNKNFSYFDDKDTLEELEAAALHDDFFYFIEGSEVMQKTYGELVKHPVPAAFADFHKKEMALLLEFKTVFDAFGAFRTDPIKALLALERERDLHSKADRIIEELNQNPFLTPSETAINYFILENE
jgi:hypothetical protein